MTRKFWFIASILTLITVISWVVFDVLHKRAQIEIPLKLQETIEPINPNFNIQVLEPAP